MKRIRITILFLLIISCSIFAQEAGDSLLKVADSVQISTIQAASDETLTKRPDSDASKGRNLRPFKKEKNASKVSGSDSIFHSASNNKTASDQASDSAVIVKAKKGPETITQLKDSVSFSKVLWSLIFLIVGYFFIKYSVKILNLFTERSSRIRLSLKRLIPIYRILAWALVIFIIIQGIIQPSWNSIIALGASIGVAIGFAAQDVLKNIFGGIILLVEKPFQVGDKIDVGSHYGEVIHIGFRATRIVTADDSVISIPNADLTSKIVSNSNSGENNCQVVAEIFLPPDIDTSKVRQIATEAAQVSSMVYLKKPISVLFFHELRENKLFLKMRLKAYVLDIRYEFSFKSEMTEIVLHELYERGIIDNK
jgi:small-conductance mechanosensitive channel